VKSAWDAAADAVPKSDQKRNMSERSEFVSFPDFGAAAAGTRRAAACGRLLLLPFLGETRKGSSRRATPGKAPRSSNRIKKRQTPMGSRFRGTTLKKIAVITTLDSRLRHAGTTVEKIAPITPRGSRLKHAGSTVERIAAITNTTGGMHASPFKTCRSDR
jgi:hypothetical protein